MATIYATLIIRGYKTWAEVPISIQPQVREVLIQLEAEHLLPEEERPGYVAPQPEEPIVEEPVQP